MVRKLDKIEKEMGYCDIKLVKERRLRRQLAFLKAELDVLDEFSRLHEGRPLLGDLPFADFGRRIEAEKQLQEEPGPVFAKAKEEFVTAGVLGLIRQEHALIEREIETVDGRFESFEGFVEKRELLLEERREALSRVAPQISARVHRLSDEFKKVEEEWNSLTEDAVSLDDALFYLSRNVDYMKSGRSFLITAKGSFDLETWMEDGFVGDLFRHTNIGRAKEMVDGANRNLKLAHKDLVVIDGFEFADFEPLLLPFLGALFDDMFLDGRLERSINAVEDAIVVCEQRLVRVRAVRERLHKDLEHTERNRELLFQRIGGEKRRGVGAAD